MKINWRTNKEIPIEFESCMVIFQSKSDSDIYEISTGILYFSKGYKATKFIKKQDDGFENDEGYIRIPMVNVINWVPMSELKEVLIESTRNKGQLE